MGLTYKLYEKLRAKIIRLRLAKKGGEHASDISTEDMIAIFRCYDYIMFNKEITQKLLSTKTTLNFDVTDKSSNLFTIELNGSTINVKLSTKILQNTSETKNITAVDALLNGMIYTSIYICILLWTRSYIDDYEFYTCIFENLVDKDMKQPSKKLLKKLIRVIQPVNNIGILVNWRNSCYVDSLITVLLFSSPDFYRREILHKDVNTVPYDKVEFLPEGTNTPTSLSSNAAKRYTSKIQSALSVIFEGIISGERMECTQFRQLIGKYLPRFLPEDGQMLSPTEVYENIFSVLFPSLKFIITRRSFSSFDPKDPTRTGKINDNSQRVTEVTFKDFVEEPVANLGGKDDNGQDITGGDVLWDKQNSDVIVMRNNPELAIKAWDKAGDEVIETIAWNKKKGKMGKIKAVYTKSRALGEYIISSRYRLFAAIMNHGRIDITATEAGGAHYTAYLRPSFDKEVWYDYDDMSKRFRKLKGLPGDVFRNSTTQRADMLFYEKIKDVDVGVMYNIKTDYPSLKFKDHKSGKKVVIDVNRTLPDFYAVLDHKIGKKYNPQALYHPNLLQTLGVNIEKLKLELQSYNDKLTRDVYKMGKMIRVAPCLSIAFGDDDTLTYKYAGMERKSEKWKGELLKLREVFEVITRDPITYGLVNKYEDQTQSKGFHSDKVNDHTHPSWIISISLGGTRPFQIKPLTKVIEAAGGETSGETSEIDLYEGDVILMNMDMQKFYKHAIQKLTSKIAIEKYKMPATRWNITFRNLK